MILLFDIVCWVPYLLVGSDINFVGPYSSVGSAKLEDSGTGVTFPRFHACFKHSAEPHSPWQMKWTRGDIVVSCSQAQSLNSIKKGLY